MPMILLYTSEAEDISIAAQFERAFHKSFQEAFVGGLALSDCFIAANSAAMDKFRGKERFCQDGIGDIILVVEWSRTFSDR